MFLCTFKSLNALIRPIDLMFRMAFLHIPFIWPDEVMFLSSTVPKCTTLSDTWTIVLANEKLACRF